MLSGFASITNGETECDAVPARRTFHTAGKMIIYLPKLNFRAVDFPIFIPQNLAVVRITEYFRKVLLSIGACFIAKGDAENNIGTFVIQKSPHRYHVFLPAAFIPNYGIPAFNLKRQPLAEDILDKLYNILNFYKAALVHSPSSYKLWITFHLE
jgi:hypothetical protein